MMGQIGVMKAMTLPVLLLPRLAGSVLLHGGKSEPCLLTYPFYTEYVFVDSLPHAKEVLQINAWRKTVAPPCRLYLEEVPGLFRSTSKSVAKGPHDPYSMNLL